MGLGADGQLRPQLKLSDMAVCADAASQKCEGAETRGCESSDPPPPLTTDASFGWLRTADADNSTDHHTEEAYTVPVPYR